MKRTITTMLMAAGICLTTSAQIKTPLMGWSSWNTYGVNISDTLIMRQADAMVKSGLKDAGYQYINIDDGYFGGRDDNGKYKKFSMEPGGKLVFREVLTGRYGWYAQGLRSIVSDLAKLS